MSRIPEEVRQKREAEVTRRRSICNECPHAVGVRTRKLFCGKCACPLAAVTRQISGKCPAGKW